MARRRRYHIRNVPESSMLAVHLLWLVTLTGCLMGLIDVLAR